MGDSELYLVIDQGGHASRAMVFDSTGQIICTAQHGIYPSHTSENHIEYSAGQLLQSVERAIKDVLTQLGVQASFIVAAGMATQRSNVACWHRETGRPVSPIISWQDCRNGEWVKQFIDQREMIHQKTGLLPNAHYGFSKLKWCLENLPEVGRLLNEGLLAWGPMSSFLSCQLTNEGLLLVDPANASRTLFYNRFENDWDEALLSLYGLPREPLPDCVDTVGYFGTLKIAEYELPLKVVSGDQSAALFVLGVPDQDAYYLNLGTGGFIQRPLEKVLEIEPGLLSSIVLKQGKLSRHALEGTVNGVGSALTWLANAEKVPMDTIEVNSNKWLEETESPPLFLNGVSGLGSPFWQEGFSSAFIGEAALPGKAVAVLESILFLVQENITAIDRYCGIGRQIYISGGLASLDRLCQLMADLSGVEVVRHEMSEATAGGMFNILTGKEHHPGGVSKSFIPGDGREIQSRYRQWQKLMYERLEV